ncbi:Glycerate 3-kinase [Heracleum sosnowskyi]|uniref:Glycerate 3-kinase n=1 Tax=Heracleum sosnowskyi TaxID=360622 RepID=A0AAD8HAK0_9APIA|nr:Glycerate 3-kinase [Heracleum sosnowskyi]
MLGFKLQHVEVAKAVDPQLETVNKYLELYFDAWYKFINPWIVIKITDPSCVPVAFAGFFIMNLSFVFSIHKFIIAMRADGKPGMTDEKVMDFVSRYLPAYKACLPSLYKEGPSGLV